MPKFPATMQKRWEESLAYRIALSFIGLSLLLALLYGIGAYATITYFMRQNEAAIQSKRIALISQGLEVALNDLNSRLSSLADNTIVINALVDTYGRDAYLVPFLKSSKFEEGLHHRLSLCDFRGEIIASNESGTDYQDVGLLTTLIKEGKPVARIVVRHQTYGILLFHPVVYPPTGSAEGFLVFETSLADFLSLHNIGDKESNGGVVLSANGQPVWTSGSTTHFGFKKWVALKLSPPLDQLGLRFAVSAPEEPAILWFTMIFAVISILALWLAVRVAYRLSGYLTRQLVVLSTAVGEIGESGVPLYDVAIEGRDEIGRLAGSFNMMIRRLRSSYDELELRVEDRTRQLAEANRELRNAELSVRHLNEDLEHLINERTAELRRTNEDLASFCYAISHELRAPIARLQGYSKALEEDFRGIPDTNFHFYTERIGNASGHLQTVVDAILLLSRLSRTELAPQPTDLSAMASEITAELQAREKERRVAVTVMPGLMATCDAKLLRICLENLLGNAFKYTERVQEARVEFGMKDGVFFVSDNGAGFDMAYEDKLFMPFQRLHQQDDYPGTGIGLATVQRIIERHDGRIWAKATEGEGATFFFTLSDS